VSDRAPEPHPAARPGDIVVLRTEDGLRFQVVRGALELGEPEVLGLAIDRLVARERDRDVGPWATNVRPGIGIWAYEPGVRWGHSLRSTWGREP
jgi:hypothetical protein